MLRVPWALPQLLAVVLFLVQLPLRVEVVLLVQTAKVLVAALVAVAVVIRQV